MNHLQLALFCCYFMSAWISGIGVYRLINRSNEAWINGFVFLGETLLLGNIVLVGGMLILSFCHLYQPFFLWSYVALQFVFLLHRSVRAEFIKLAGKLSSLTPAAWVFFTIISVFIFRNCYFMVDIDSNSTYLFTQKLWLLAGTSLTGNSGTDLRVFLPQFDAVPYSLGISLFGQETFFPELINLMWRLITLFLVFGYTSYKLGDLCSLASVLFVLLNDHFFYSGANQWVIINAAIIALAFSAAYNFWESRELNSPFRFSLAIVFASQLLANKYQMAYVSFFVVGLGCLVQTSIKDRVKQILFDQKRFIFVAGACILALLWYVKNWIVTGDPAFPIFAGILKSFNWTKVQWHAFVQTQRGDSNAFHILKYITFFFIWPGMFVLKYVIVTLLFFPVLMLIAFKKQRFDSQKFYELCYWLGLSFLITFGIAIAMFMDPRYFRFVIAIAAYTTVLATVYFANYCMGFKNKSVIGLILIVLACRGGFNEGLKLVFSEGGMANRPTIKANLQVLLNQMHTDDALKIHYPWIDNVKNTLRQEPDKANRVAWEIPYQGGFPSFLLPARPIVSPLWTSIIRWDSYQSADLIMHDLQDAEIQWIGRFEKGNLKFISAAEYAKEMVNFDLQPKHILFDYGFPKELAELSS